MENRDQQTEAVSSDTPREFFTVGIGTSAGGLEAIEQFFSTMPSNTGMAFVVIQHLSPTHKSYMVELLSRRTKMPVQHAEQDIQIRPNNVYLIPASKNITVQDGVLKLTNQDRSNNLPNYPIDIFFDSLAKNVADRSIGIVLSGTGSDGSRGLRAIKEAGGLALVQDPESAQFDGMPNSAMSAALIDQVMKPEDMPELLINYTQHLSEFTKTHVGDEEDLLPDHYQRILDKVREQTSINFQLYKPPTIKRRIQHRMGLLHLNDLDEYANLIAKSPKETTALLQEFLIGVTRFFRNPEAWDFLEVNTIPYLFKQAMKKPSPVIRCWISGCSTGEEAYTLAMLLHEYKQEFNKNVEIKIFATDIDVKSIEKASRGFYSSNIVTDVNQSRLHKYFIRQGEYYQISRELRQMIIFTPHNLTEEVPFANIDFISCRNLLIYLKPLTQARVLSNFAHSLIHNGILFLGKSEHITGFEKYYEPVHSAFNIFRKEGQPKKLSSASIFHENASKRHQVATASRFIPQNAHQSTNDYLREVLATYMPPSLVVTKSNHVLYIMGDINPFLNLKPGSPEIIVPRIVHSDIRILVGTALHNVFKEKKSFTFENVSFTPKDELIVFDLVVEPIRESSEVSKAVLFFKVKEHTEDIPVKPTSYDLDALASSRIEDLERRLQQTDESLHAAIEELETSNEELHATNEELMASNEELQSTNEELQSTNEELSTVNSEIQIKVLELMELTRDMDNLLESTQLSTIFLDEDLCIRKFTHHVSKYFSIRTLDIGRPIFHFTHIFQDVDFDSLCRKVLHSGENIELNVEGEPDTWYLLRLTPYVTEKGATMGVVITIIDTTEIEKSKRITELNKTLSEEVVKRTESQKTLEDLIYLTSHEIKSPLRSFRFLAETIQENVSEEHRDMHQPSFAEMYKRIDRMGKIVDDLLYYSRLTRAGENTEKLQVKNLVDSLLKRLEVPDSFKITTDLKGLDAINTNREKLERVLHIIIHNAIVHHDKAEGQVHITAKSTNAKTRFTVSDDGPGMTEEKQRMVFDLFDPERPRAEKGGVGMGLFMAKKSVEHRGGTLLLNAKKKRGLSVDFDWPHKPRTQPDESTD